MHVLGWVGGGGGGGQILYSGIVRMPTKVGWEDCGEGAAKGGRRGSLSKAYPFKESLSLYI